MAQARGVPGSETEAEPRVRRSFVFRELGKVLLGVLAGVVVVDVVVGWVDTKRDLATEGMLGPDPELFWDNRPGFRDERTTISSIGLRSPEIPPDAPPDELRVLGLGGSRIFGAGKGGPAMGEVWSGHLEEALSAEVGAARVLNGGVVGYSALQSARRGVRLLPVVDPDLVLLFLSPGAQVLLGANVHARWVETEYGLLPSDLAESWPPLLRPWVALVHELLLKSNVYRRYRSQFVGGEKRDPAIADFILSAGELPPPAHGMIERTLAEVIKLREAAEARGATFIVVVLPEPQQQSEERWAPYLRNNVGTGAPPLGTPRDEPTRRLLELLREAGVTTWSMERELYRMGTDLERYHCDFGHWSAEGHALIAAGLLQRARMHGLLERLVQARRADPRRS